MGRNVFTMYDKYDYGYNSQQSAYHCSVKFETTQLVFLFETGGSMPGFVRTCSHKFRGDNNLVDNMAFGFCCPDISRRLLSRAFVGLKRLWSLSVDYEKITRSQRCNYTSSVQYFVFRDS